MLAGVAGVGGAEGDASGCKAAYPPPPGTGSRPRQPPTPLKQLTPLDCVDWGYDNDELVVCGECGEPWLRYVVL